MIRRNGVRVHSVMVPDDNSIRDQTRSPKRDLSPVLGSIGERSSRELSFSQSKSTLPVHSVLLFHFSTTYFVFNIINVQVSPASTVVLRCPSDLRCSLSWLPVSRSLPPGAPRPEIIPGPRSRESKRVPGYLTDQIPFVQTLPPLNKCTQTTTGNTKQYQSSVTTQPESQSPYSLFARYDVCPCPPLLKN